MPSTYVPPSNVASREERNVIMEENNGRRKVCFSFQKMALICCHKLLQEENGGSGTEGPK
jgi:hypothetical protein